MKTVKVGVHKETEPWWASYDIDGLNYHQSPDTYSHCTEAWKNAKLMLFLQHVNILKCNWINFLSQVNRKAFVSTFSSLYVKTCTNSQKHFKVSYTLPFCFTEGHCFLCLRHFYTQCAESTGCRLIIILWCPILIFMPPYIILLSNLICLGQL